MWTYTPPTEPGWYFYRRGDVTTILKLFWNVSQDVLIDCGDIWPRADSLKGQWYSQRIEEPEE